MITLNAADLTDLRERFERFVPDRDPTRCWEWFGSTDSYGYGRIRRGLRGTGVMRAHQAAWEIYVGPIPEGMLVVRRCGSTTCSNPSHHFIGTQADAARAAEERGVPNRARGMRNGKTKLTDRQVAAIREIYAARVMNQRQIAEHLGISSSTVQGIVSGGRRWAA